MATNVTDDSDLSEEEFVISAASTVSTGLRGFQFEPQHDSIIDGESSDGADRSGDGVSDTDSDGDDGRPPPRLGVGNTTWCQCGRCDVTTLSQERECRCCNEVTVLKKLLRPTDQDPAVSCVTANEDFTTLALTQVVLENVLVSLNNVRHDGWEVNPPSNRSLRWAAYRQFVWWTYGRLGRRVRVIIPSCVVNIIRKTFPKPEDDTYEGFHSGLSGGESD